MKLAAFVACAIWGAIAATSSLLFLLCIVWGRFFTNLSNVGVEIRIHFTGIVAENLQWWHPLAFAALLFGILMLMYFRAYGFPSDVHGHPAKLKMVSSCCGGCSIAIYAYFMCYFLRLISANSVVPDGTYSTGKIDFLYLLIGTFIAFFTALVSYEKLKPASADRVSTYNSNQIPVLTSLLRNTQSKSSPNRY